MEYDYFDEMDMESRVLHNDEDYDGDDEWEKAFVRGYLDLGET